VVSELDDVYEYDYFLWNAREVIYPGEIMRDVLLRDLILRLMFRKFDNYCQDRIIKEKQKNA